MIEVGAGGRGGQRPADLITHESANYKAFRLKSCQVGKEEKKHKLKSIVSSFDNWHCQ
jgi:hypothetical protein